MNISEFLLVLTDVDGTLLDFNTYSVKKSLPAIVELQKRKIPLVLCSSKTFIELDQTWQALNLKDPFICENGAAIFIPPEYFNFQTVEKLKSYQGWEVIEFSQTYSEILDIFRKVQKSVSFQIRGVHEMSVEEVSKVSGLNLEKSYNIKQRLYTEPFIIMDRIPEKVEEVGKVIYNLGYNFTEGGRFFHLFSHAGKGAAAQYLINLYQRKFPSYSLITVGSGDSYNDLSLLEVVDYPVLVKKPSGLYDERVQCQSLYKTKGIGPAGFCEAILDILKNRLKT